MHKCRRNRTNTKPKGNGWEPPAGSDPFAHQIAWDFKDDIRDKEDREHFVVIKAYQSKILVEASQLGISCSGVSRPRGSVKENGIRTDIGSINKAKQIHDSNCWNDVQINLQPQS